MLPVFGGPRWRRSARSTGSRGCAGAGAIVSAGAAAVFAQIGSTRVGARRERQRDRRRGAARAGARARASSRPADAARDARVDRVGGVVHGGHAGVLRAPLPLAAARRTRSSSRRHARLAAPDRHLRGEGMLTMYDYPRAGARPGGLASPSELGIWLFPNLRLRNATDGLIALKAGLSVRVPRLGDRLQGAVQLPLAHRHARTTSTTTRSPTASACARRSSGASTSAGSASAFRSAARSRRARAPPRAMRTSPANAASVDQLEQPPHLGPRLDPELARSARRRAPAARAAAGPPASASARQLPRQLEMRLDRLLHGSARRGSRACPRPTAP